jgi:hypothetical protein
MGVIMAMGVCDNDFAVMIFVGASVVVVKM